MELHYVLLLMMFEAKAGNVEVQGEISIKLNDPNQESEELMTWKPHKHKYLENVVVNNDIKLFNGDGKRVVRGYENGQMTVGPIVECTYQVPEETQVQALLSNMMNELTKMFVRAHEILDDDFRRRGEKRFRVVHKKQSDFFEDIYSNMTKQYLTLYNSKVRADRSGGKKDPCENQEEMKEVWKDLLDGSLTTFRQAAFKCIDEHLKVRGEADDSEVREKMSQYLLRVISKIKMSQLVLLCDKFQLCYHELIR